MANIHQVMNCIIVRCTCVPVRISRNWAYCNTTNSRQRSAAQPAGGNGGNEPDRLDVHPRKRPNVDGERVDGRPRDGERGGRRGDGHQRNGRRGRCGGSGGGGGGSGGGSRRGQAHPADVPAGGRGRDDRGRWPLGRQPQRARVPGAAGGGGRRRHKRGGHGRARSGAAGQEQEGSAGEEDVPGLLRGHPPMGAVGREGAGHANSGAMRGDGGGGDGGGLAPGKGGGLVAVCSGGPRT
ncbi:hypothetical protein BU14_0251s0012 [Porphyra umbilicalis]|uniref:Uncharacterized protein n=1 Tax=Porphyra umbilicalis TaxID=2786 RepID=A0A1X6P2P6_PORUM|nr:hypothetical protein BU14_0251s0012 [Porphyra umbilicalis]|eukprot:OSX75172.1 hypothetical protein BU14_0251s0012 [Porphyra umbilicalis]